MQWVDVMADPCLKDLPYKIELDEKGRIVMSPASNRHGKLQAKTIQLLARLLNEGDIVTKCAIGTHAGVKVADVAWLSPAFSARHGETTPYPEAPDLCVEVLSPFNSPSEMTEKIRLYLGYGAKEVWLIDDDGCIRAFGPEGERSRSVLLGTQIPAL